MVKISNLIDLGKFAYLIDAQFLACLEIHILYTNSVRFFKGGGENKNYGQMSRIEKINFQYSNGIPH